MTQAISFAFEKHSEYSSQAASGASTAGGSFTQSSLDQQNYQVERNIIGQLGEFLADDLEEERKQAQQHMSMFM
jgi:aspartate-semialdehyde dehydrogenase